VSEDYDGLDDDDEEMPPTIAARTRSSIARRFDAARHMFRGTGASDGADETGTDASESATDADAWPERIKALYDVGDGSDERVAEVLNSIRRIEGALANAPIGDMHF
jgi:hypothetical protein